MDTFIKFSSVTKLTGGQQNANGQFCNEAGTAFGGNINFSNGASPAPGLPGNAVAPIVVDLSSIDPDVVYAFKLTPVVAV